MLLCDCTGRQSRSSTRLSGCFVVIFGYLVLSYNRYQLLWLHLVGWLVVVLTCAVAQVGYPAVDPTTISRRQVVDNDQGQEGQMALAARLTLAGAPAEDPEDFFGASLAMFDDTINLRT